MNYKTKLIALAAVSTLALGSEAAWAADNANASATATVVNPIAIANSRALAFGSIATVSTGGSVAIAATDAGAVTDTTVASSGTQSSAKFTVTGGAYNTYTLTVPGTVTLTRGSGGTGLTMSATLASSIGGTAGAGTLGSAGTEDVFVGGTLTVGANQADGAYTGTFNVSVAYN